MEPDITTESSSVMTYGGYSAAGVRVPRVKHETINNFHKAIVPKEENVEELNPSNDGSGYSAAGIRLPSNADRKHNKTKGRSRKTNKQDDEVMAGPQFSSSSHFAALSSQIKSMSDSTRHLDDFFAQKTPPYTATADNGTYASGDRAAGGAASANHHPSRLFMNNKDHLDEDDARGRSIRPRHPITGEMPGKTNTRKVFPNFGTLSIKSADYSDTTITVSADLHSNSDYDDETTDTSIRSAKKIESLLLFQKPDLLKHRDDNDVPTFSTRWNKMKSGSLKFNNDHSLLDLSELSTSPPKMKTSNSRTPMFIRGRGSEKSVASSVVSDLPYVPPRKEGLIPINSSALLQSKQSFARDSSGILSTGQASSDVSDVPLRNEGMIFNTRNIGTAQPPQQLFAQKSPGLPTVQVPADVQFLPPRREGLIPNRTMASTTPSEQLLSRDSSGRSTAYSSGRNLYATSDFNDSIDEYAEPSELLLRGSGPTKLLLNDSRHASASSLTVASSVVSELPYIPPRKPGLIPESPKASILSTTGNAEREADNYPQQLQHEVFVSRNATQTTCYLSPPQLEEDLQFDGTAYKEDEVQQLREGLHPYAPSKQPKHNLVAASTLTDQLGISTQDPIAIPQAVTLTTPIAHEQWKYQPHSGSAKWDKSTPPQGTIFPSRATTSAYYADAVPVCEQQKPRCDDYIENYLTQREQQSKDQEEGIRGISRDASNKTKSSSSRWTEPASSLTVASSIVSDLPNINTIKELAKTEAHDSMEIPEERAHYQQVATDSLPFASPWLAGAIPNVLLSHTDQSKEAMSRNHDSAISVASDIGSNVQTENPLIIDSDRKSTFLQNLPALRKLQKHVSDMTDWDNSNSEVEGALSHEASIKINSQDKLDASMTDELEACKKYLSIDNEDIEEDFGCHIDPSEQKRDKLRIGRNLVLSQGNTVGVSDLTISSDLLNESNSTLQNSSWYGPTLVCVEEVSCYNSDAEIDETSANNPSRHHIRESPHIVDKPAHEEFLSEGGEFTHINSQFVLCDSQSIEKKPSKLKKAPFYDKEGDLAAGISTAPYAESSAIFESERSSEMLQINNKSTDFVPQNDRAATAAAGFAMSSKVNENGSIGSRSDQLESYERKELIEDKNIAVPGMHGFPCIIPSSNQQETRILDDNVGDLVFDHDSLHSLGKPLNTSIGAFSKKLGDDSSIEQNDSNNIDDLIPLEVVSPFALVDTEDYGDSNICTLQPQETVPIETFTGKIAPDLHVDAPPKIESASIDDNALYCKEKGTASLHSAEESGSVEATSSRLSNIMLDDDFVLEVDFPTKASDFENIGDLDVSFPSLEARRTIRQKMDSSDDSEKHEESVRRATPRPFFVDVEHVSVESNQNIEDDVDVIIPLVGSDRTEDLSAGSSSKTRSKRNSSQSLSSSHSSPRELYERDEGKELRNILKPVFVESLPAEPTEETIHNDLDERLSLVEEDDSHANDKGNRLLNSMRSTSSRSWSSQSLSSAKSSSGYSPLEGEEENGVLNNPPLFNDNVKGHHIQPSIKQQRREDLYNSGFVDEGIVIDTDKERPGLNDSAYDRKSFMRDFNDDYAMEGDEESGSFDAVSVLASLHERPDADDEHSRTTEGKDPTFFVETLKRLTKPCRPMTWWKYMAIVALLFFIVGVIVVAALLIPRSASENAPASNNPTITSPPPSNNYSTFETSEWIESSIGAYAFSLPGDGTGFSVSLSGQGDRLAVGSPYLDTSYGTRAGLVALYEGSYVNGKTLTWALIGKLYGNVSGQEFGISVSMNDDGGVLSVGSLKSGSSTGGLVQVFQIHDPPSKRNVRHRSLTRNRSPKNEVSGVSSNGAEANQYEMLSNYALSQIGQTLQQEDSVTGDYYGYSLFLSSAGDVLAVGAPKVGNNSGKVFAYSYDNSSNLWTNIYLDNSTAVENDLLGWSVAISGDGTMLAAGAPQQFNSVPGYVNLYHVDDGTLVDTISSSDARATSAAGPDDFGFSVSLDYTGQTVAIGSPNSTTSSSTSGGYAAVFAQTPSSSQWTLMGGKILEGSAGDAVGYSIALSHDGTMLATGTPKSANNVGAVRIYNFTNATTWEMAPAIEGGVTGGDFGSSTSLSADGTRCAVGVPFLSSCSSSSKTGCTAGTSLIFDSPATT